MWNVCLSFWSISKAHGGAESMNRYPSWLYCTLVGLSVAFYKKVVFKNFTIFTGTRLCWGLFFNQVIGLQFCNFFKKRVQHRCFLWIFGKYFRLAILKNICERQLLDCFSGSLLHRPKDSRSILCDCHASGSGSKV